jgi:predicted nucleotidyltransferase
MNNLILYGSYAREDSCKESDVDLVSIGKSQYAKKSVKNNVNLTQYSYNSLKSMAQTGSLFVYHLKEEGKILVDDKDRFEILFRDFFILKKSYDEEKYFAFELLKKINNIYLELDNIKFANAKIVWCLRTIFASIGAESKIPIFATGKIRDEFGENLSKVLLIKKSNSKNVKILENAIIQIENLLGPLLPQKIPTGLKRYERRVMKILKNKDYLTTLEFY